MMKIYMDGKSSKILTGVVSSETGEIEPELEIGSTLIPAARGEGSSAGGGLTPRPFDLFLPWPVSDLPCADADDVF